MNIKDRRLKMTKATLIAENDRLIKLVSNMLARLDELSEDFSDNLFKAVSEKEMKDD